MHENMLKLVLGFYQGSTLLAKSAWISKIHTKPMQQSNADEKQIVRSADIDCIWVQNCPDTASRWWKPNSKVAC